MRFGILAVLTIMALPACNSDISNIAEKAACRNQGAEDTPSYAACVKRASDARARYLERDSGQRKFD
jgi:hypothetical protein